MSSALMAKLLKTGVIKHSAVLSESILFQKKDLIRTHIPALNVAFSGDLDGGLTPGLTVVAGPSKHFKTNMSLIGVKAYLDKYKDSICLLYDSEFGITPEYLKMHGVDPERVLHIPIENIEQLKFDIVARLEEIKRGDKVIIMIDSVGNLASKKEVEDAKDEKSVADMSRAKSLKSLFRILTPHLTTKDIPCIAINHTYQEMGLFPKAIVSGGCLVEGTKIQMIDGLKEVQDIKVGELVQTLDGEKMVTHTWNPDTLEFGEPECYEIEFEDGSKVTVSNQHPFLTENGWVDAEDLKEDDIVLKI